MPGSRSLSPKACNVPIRLGFERPSNSSITMVADTAVKELAERGRVLLRPSGTEALLRVVVKGIGEERVSRIALGLAEVVRAAAAQS